MGPRQGSPAAETQRKKFTTFLLAVWILGSCTLPSAWAATSEVTHQVTVVVVPPELSLKNEGENPSLTFSRRAAGSQSAPYEASYRIASNTLPTESYAGVVSARIEEIPDGILLQADVGSFSNNGTKGNIVLYENIPGYKTLGKELIPLADKTVTSGTQAGVLNGTLPISWQAIATKKLSLENNTLVVTVTLKDA